MSFASRSPGPYRFANCHRQYGSLGNPPRLLAASTDAAPVSFAHLTEQSQPRNLLVSIAVNQVTILKHDPRRIDQTSCDKLVVTRLMKEVR
jgi:hypothetical protein